MPYCNSCGGDLPEKKFYCPNCGAAVELVGETWDRYALMLTDPAHTTVPNISDRIPASLSKLERMGLVSKNSNGKYELIEIMKLDILLSHLFGKQKKASFRHAFYLTFLTASFLLFVYYIVFIPQEPFMTMSLSFSFLLFSLIAIIFEAIDNKRLMAFIKRVLTSRACAD